MKKNYRELNHVIFCINYHFVFCPRYRRKALVGDVKAQFEALLRQICSNNDFIILALEVMPDHVYLFLSAPPSVSPTDIMSKIKQETSKKLRQELFQLHHLPSLWTRTFFCSTQERLSEDIILEYVATQKTRA